MEGNGIDGVTNSFAAAIWFIDFFFECALFGFYDVHYEGHISSDNFQGVLGPGPAFQPSSIYYAMIFTILSGNGYPSIVIPSVSGGISSKIKAWGLETVENFRVVLLNRDQNTTLNGVVYVQVQSKPNSLMRCIYMEAPSLSSKGEDITIGGLKYNPNNSTPTGTFNEVTYNYDSLIGGYKVQMRYAQVASCSIPNANLIIPSISECSFENYPSIAVLLIAILCLVGM